MNWPVRSPQNASCNGSNGTAPASIARSDPSLLDGQVHAAVSPAQRPRRDDPHRGELGSESQRGVAEAQLDGQDLPTRQNDAVLFLGTQHGRVPRTGPVGIANHHMPRQ